MHRIEWIGLAIVVASLISMSASLGGPTTSSGSRGSGLRVLLRGVPTLVVVVLVFVAIRSGHGRSGFLYGAGSRAALRRGSAGHQGCLHLGCAPWSRGQRSPTSSPRSIPMCFSSSRRWGCSSIRPASSAFASLWSGRCPTSCAAPIWSPSAWSSSVSRCPRTPPLSRLRLGGFVGVLVGSVLVAAGRPQGARARPCLRSTSDLGLGAVLVTEVDSLDRPFRRRVWSAGRHADQRFGRGLRIVLGDMSEFQREVRARDRAHRIQGIVAVAVAAPARGPCHRVLPRAAERSQPLRSLEDRRCPGRRRAG